MNFNGRNLTAGKQYVRGTHRTRTPAETLARMQPHLAEIGITRLANVTGLDTLDVPVYVAIRPGSLTLATSQGKGLDRDAAKASAMMESIELWHAERPPLPLRRASYHDLVGERARVVDPDKLPLRPGASFDPHQVRLWATGFDIVAGREILVPLDSVAFDRLEAPPTFMTSSNGLASGNHLLEAMVHGACEVIERDAEVLWRISNDVRRLDLESIDESYCAEILRRIARNGTVAAAWDITSDVGLPAYAAVLIDPPDAPRWRSVGFYSGFGCHLSRGVALARALTEAAQVRLTYVSGSRDDIFRDRYAETTDPELWQDYWKEVKEMPVNFRFADRPSLETDSFEGDLEVIRDALGRVGLDQIIVVDLSRPHLQIPVVKVIIPGLEGIEAEAELGARARRLIEEQAP